MKKTYITPATFVVNTIVTSHILTGSLKIGSEEVTEGWVKGGGDWDIFGEDAAVINDEEE